MGRAHCVSVYAVGTKFLALSCIVLVVVEVAVVMLVVVVVSTGSGSPPTLDSPLSPFRRFVLPLFTSHPRARRIPLFFIRLSSFRFAFFVSPALFLFSILDSPFSSFLPASPFHRLVFMLFLRLPPSFFPSLYSHFSLFFPSFRDICPDLCRIRLGTLPAFNNDRSRASIEIPGP